MEVKIFLPWFQQLESVVLWQKLLILFRRASSELRRLQPGLVASSYLSAQRIYSIHSNLDVVLEFRE